MRLAAERLQHFLQLVKSAARKANHLLSLVDDMDLGDVQSVHDHNVAVVILPCGSRAAGEAGISGLDDDYLVGGDTGLEDSPLFDERPWANHHERLAAAAAKTNAIGKCGLIPGEDLGVSNDRFQAGNETGSVGRWHRVFSVSRNGRCAVWYLLAKVTGTVKCCSEENRRPAPTS